MEMDTQPATSRGSEPPNSGQNSECEQITAGGQAADSNTRRTRAAARRLEPGANGRQENNVNRDEEGAANDDSASVHALSALLQSEDGEIRVGKAYQVPVPEFVPNHPKSDTLARLSKDVCLWKPSEKPMDLDDLEQFCIVAKQKCHCSVDQLPHKNIKSLVEYYYMWKKTRYFTSYMQLRQNRGSSERDSDANPSDDETANAVKTQSCKSTCKNCGQSFEVPARAAETIASIRCPACTVYWRRTTKMHASRAGRVQLGDSCPDGWLPFLSDFAEFASARVDGANTSHGQAKITNGEQQLLDLDRKIADAHQRAQKLHMRVSQRTADEKLDSVGISKLKLKDPLPTANKKTNARWADNEKLIAVQGFRRYGRDFEAIADLLPQKLAEHVHYLYDHYRSIYALDQLIAERESELEAARAKRDKELALRIEKEEVAAKNETGDCILLSDDED